MKTSKISSFTLAFFIFSFAFNCYAKEVTIIYTGQTHGMIYACSCPIEPDGGISRRATLIKQLEKEHPDHLLLDSGDFFAGGLMDEYTQNTELDSQRSLINLEAMELMKYDAAAIGDDEFNFGKKFLENNIVKSKLTFLSCSLKLNKVLPYIIKEVAGTKIGVVGVTVASAKQKAEGLEFQDPKLAVGSAVNALKKKGAKIIVLLSQLGENEDLSLIKDVQGIDILIESHNTSKEGLYTKTGDTLLLRPSWEGRHLDYVNLDIEADKIAKYNVEDTRLSDKIAPDAGILSILPKCFSDTNCKKEGFIGTCKNAATSKSQCEFVKPDPVRLLIITPKECAVCQTLSVSNFLKKQFPGLNISYIYYPDSKADGLIKDFEITGLPAYLLGKEAKKEKNFDNLRPNLKPKGDYFMMAPYFTGFSYFLNRQNTKGKLDLFISLYQNETAQVLAAIKEFNPQIHFLAAEEANKFDAPGGEAEIEEDLRAVCVKKYYPNAFWDYISCRSKDIKSTWWEDCASSLDLNKIKTCARQDEGKRLLRENTALNKDLNIMTGPSYLLDNQEIFGSRGAPSKEDLHKLIKR